MWTESLFWEECGRLPSWIILTCQMGRIDSPPSDMARFETIIFGESSSWCKTYGTLFVIIIDCPLARRAQDMDTIPSCLDMKCQRKRFKGGQDYGKFAHTPSHLPGSNWDFWDFQGVFLNVLPREEISKLKYRQVLVQKMWEKLCWNPKTSKNTNQRQSLHLKRYDWMSILRWPWYFSNYRL